MGQDLQRLEAAADRLELIELLHCYAQAIDTWNWDLLRQVFTEDAVADYSSMDKFVEGEPMSGGREAIIGWLRAAIEPFPGVMHFMSNHLSKVDGDRATTSTYMHVLHLPMGGIYHGEAVRTADGWRLKRLRLEERSFEEAANRLQTHMESFQSGGDA